MRRAWLVAGTRIGLHRDLSRQAVQLDYPIAMVAIHDSLDVRPDVCVASEDEEASRMRANCLVLFKRHVDSLDAGVVGALADPLAKRVDGAERVVEIPDPLVDVSKERLVSKCARRAASRTLGCRHAAPHC